MFNKDKTYPVEEYNQYLSFLDLEQHPEWSKAWKEQDQKKVEEILHYMGCDLRCGYQIEVNLHRSRKSQQVEYGPRVSFCQRVDKEFQQTGMSIEDQILNTQDDTLRDILEEMSRGSITGQFLDYAKEHEIKED